MWRHLAKRFSSSIWTRSNTTSAYGISKNKVEADTYTCLIDDDDVREAIIKSEYNADVLPSNTQLAGAPIELVSVPRREMRLRTVLAPVVPLYDYIFIDCAPSLDLLTVNALCAADTVIIPMQCEFFALELERADGDPENRAQKVQPLLRHRGRAVHDVLRAAQPDDAGRRAGQKVLWRQGLPRRHSAHRAPERGPELRYADQLL